MKGVEKDVGGEPRASDVTATEGEEQQQEYLSSMSPEKSHKD